TMSGSGPYTRSISIPTDSVDTLYYLFKAADGDGNWASTSERSVSISDDDPPIWGADSTPVTATTGDPFTFVIQISDNIGVQSITVEYWFGSGTHNNISMTGSGPYQYQITIPSGSTSTLHYIFHASDQAANWVATSVKNVSVSDNDAPVFGSDTSPTSATTGDPYVFSISVSDNIALQAVTVEYWFGSGTHVNTSMSGTGPYSYQISVPGSSTDTLHYIFHAGDTGGIWSSTLQKDVTVSDNDLPVLSGDNTPSRVITGGTLTFSINVSDNIQVLEVRVEYWFGSGSHTNVSMSGSGPYTCNISIPSGSISTLYYIFAARDTAGNWASTTTSAVSVSDGVPPVFGTDSTPSTGTTGDPLTFTVSVTDNVAVQTVTVEYWFGTGSHTNVTMSGSGPYSYQITVPSGSTSTLHYLFHGSDTSGNWAHTSESTVAISDNDPPALATDQSPSTATTGDPYTISVTVSDNIGVGSVAVEYWFGTGSHTNVSMSGSGPYSYQITVPSGSTSTLHYVIRGGDTSGNWFAASRKDISVVDNDRPVPGTDSTPAQGTTGDPLTFSVSASDNIGVQTVTVEYWFGSGSHTNVSMTGSGPYTRQITVVSNSISTLHYVFHISDAAANWASSTVKDVTIIDNDKPTFGTDSSPSTVGTGNTYIFSVQVTDNVQVQAVRVEYWFGSGSHTNVSMTGSGPYTYQISIPASSLSLLNYIFRSRDQSGNWASTSGSTVTVEDDDAPVFGSDQTPATGTTGDPFTFRTGVTDNIGVSSVTVEYWFGSGSHTNTSMSGSGTYTLPITIPSDSVLTLHYVLHTSDQAGNWGTTSRKDVIIVDNDRPVIGPDTTSTTGTTGDPFTFRTGVTDNIGVSSVRVEYWFGTGTHQNMTMTLNVVYQLQIIIPSDSTDTLSYIFHSSDGQGNWGATSIAAISIRDNDMPALVSDTSDGTAFTGDDFTFTLALSDNIGITVTTIEYWFGSGTPANTTLPGPSPYTYKIPVPVNGLDALHYIIHSGDEAGNWFASDRVDVSVIDNDLPSVLEDMTSGLAGTGSDLFFRLRLEDNIGISSVHVEYRFGQSSKQNLTMAKAGQDIWEILLGIPADSLDSVRYEFHFSDTFGNWGASTGSMVSVFDDDLPVITEFSPVPFATTGDPYRIDIKLSDNIGVQAAFLEYWFEGGSRRNESMTGPDPFTFQVDIPSASTAPLHLVVRFHDTSGNWNAGYELTVNIIDDDDPVISEPSAPAQATTGDPFTISFSSTDNIGLAYVRLVYRFTGSSEQTVVLSGGPLFEHTLDIPISQTGEVHVLLNSTDGSGNSAEHRFAMIFIVDNDPPTISMINAPVSVGTGEQLIIDLQAEDNIGLGEAYLLIGFEDDDPSDQMIYFDGNGHFTLDHWIDLDRTGPFVVRITVNDLSGNTCIIYSNTSVVDTIPPTIAPIEDIRIYEGDRIEVAAQASDNIGISSFEWRNGPFTSDEGVYSGQVTGPGVFDIELVVHDMAGNPVSVLFQLVVLATDHDEDGDGIPDLEEIALGLDPEDGSDASGDLDNDGLSNIDEYGRGTSLTSGDTDNDGMPDKWEIDHGLDPILHSAGNDADGDGSTDLEEFERGSDPLTAPPGEGGSPLIFILIGIILLLLVGGGIAAFVIIRKKRSSEETNENGDS
ncbi:MAG: hypothetical protein ACMUHU_04955, partial [Thermoplasmatota archaeon]